MTFRIALFAAFLPCLCACAPTITTHGNMLPPHKLEKVEPGITSRAELEQNWGPPSAVSPFDNKTWYYIGETDSQKGIFPHEVEKRQIIKVTFDDSDLVTAATNVDPKQGQDIDIVSRKTPAAGKEYTAVQQFIGNLGRFNKSTEAAKKPGQNN